MSRYDLLLAATKAITVGILVFPGELPAQHVNEARTGIARNKRSAAYDAAASAAFSDAGCRAPQYGNTRRFRPVGMVVGALLGATYGGLTYIAASETGDELLSFSNYRFPKAVAVGAAVGLLVDVVRYYGSGRPSGAHE